MASKLTPCIWLDNQAKQAAELYSAAFVNTTVISQSPMVTELEISAHRFILLDGGPRLSPTPNSSISFFCIFETEKELLNAWDILCKEGEIFMPLDSYAWSEKYGWIGDRFGVSWQLSLGKISDVGQMITPCLLFTQNQFGRVDEAIQHYCSVFKNSSVDGILRWDENEGKELAGKVKHAQILLNGNKMMLMESLGHDFSFNEGVSLTVYCETQEEIDYYWEGLLSGGGNESMCGWLSDRFGVWWQVVPSILSELMRDPEKAGKAVKAFMPMKKLDIRKIVEATNA